MVLARDTASELIALYNAFGAIDQVNAVGNVTTGGVAVPDPTVQAVTTATLAQATTAFALPAPSAGKKIVMILTQDATGSRLATFTTASGTVLWPGGRAANVLSTPAASVDVIVGECRDGANWFLTLSKAYAV